MSAFDEGVRPGGRCLGDFHGGVEAFGKQQGRDDGFLDGREGGEHRFQPGFLHIDISLVDHRVDTVGKKHGRLVFVQSDHDQATFGLIGAVGAGHHVQRQRPAAGGRVHAWPRISLWAAA